MSSFDEQYESLPHGEIKEEIDRIRRKYPNDLTKQIEAVEALTRKVCEYTAKQLKKKSVE